MRSIIVILAAGGSLIMLAGCGSGGLTQEDMRRHAIRRPGDGDSNDKVVSKPAVNPTDANTNQQAASSQTTPITAPSKARPTDQQHRIGTPSPPAAALHDAAPANISTTPPPPPVLRKPTQPLTVIERRQRTIDNLTRIGDAMRRYCDKNGRLFSRAICSAQGQPLLSWRVELLPYLGYQELYGRFDTSEPWDSARNKPMVKLIPDVFQSPDRLDEKTNYLVPVASFSAFGRLRGIGTRNVEDGMQDTVVLVETNDADAVTWTQPEDLYLDINRLDTQLGTLRDDGFFVVWGDGKVTRVSPERSVKDLKAVFSFDGGDLFRSHVMRAAAEATPASTSQHTNSNGLAKDPPRAGAEQIGGTAPVVPANHAPPTTSLRRRAQSERAQSQQAQSQQAQSQQAQSQQAQSQRMPVPDTQSLDRARRLVREIYEEEYTAARTVRERQTLAKGMLRQLSEMVDDPAGQYVILDIVIDVASHTGDSATTIDAMEEMLARFEVDQVKYKHDILKQLAKQRDRGRAVNQALLDQASKLLETALLAEKFDTAESLCQIALGAARQLKDEKEEADMERQQQLIEEARRAFRTLHRTIANLENAEDPKANSDVGQYYCLIQGEWEKGLPMLAKGNHIKLKKLALAELRGPTESTHQLELADGWWQLGSEEEACRKALHVHASYWYLRALDTLPQGLQRVKADLRVKQVEREYGPHVRASFAASK